jgi:hypothetical protein
MIEVRHPATITYVSLINIVQPSYGNPHNHLSNGNQGVLPGVPNVRGVKLTTYLHLVQRSRMAELYLHPLMYFNYIAKQKKTGPVA